MAFVVDYDQLMEELEKAVGDENPDKFKELIESLNNDELNIVKEVLMLGIVARRATF